LLARAFVRGHPPQVVQICAGNSSSKEIAELLVTRSLEIERFVTPSRAQAKVTLATSRPHCPS
jgi:predicted nuclease of predicted toxin-antitoxin system